VARLDAGSFRFAQRSSWLLRDQISSDDEHVDVDVSDGDDAEEVKQDNCNAEKAKVENKFQEVEDLVTVCDNCVFGLNLLNATNAMQCVAGSLR
jgi:hypothetical protein